MKYGITFLLILSQLIRLQAQRPDTTLAAYSEHFQQEKIHFHFDKTVYNKGETIWFKTYLMAGFDPSEYSRNVYIDWYGADGKLLYHEVEPVVEASARGQFDVPADYTGAYVQMRAYTRWMLNFDSAFLFTKNIPVWQTKAVTARAEKPGSGVQFFPEGGDLVNGLLSRVAFKAVGSNGMPVKIRGVVKAASGDVIDSLRVEHDGMGSFFIQPEDGVVYIASWTDEYGNAYTGVLPAAQKSGATLQLQPRSAQCLVVIKRSEPAAANLKSLFVVAHMNQNVVYSAQVKLDAESSAMTKIPTDSLPTGVLQVTLFNADWAPLAERIVFVNNGRHLFNVMLSLPEKNLDKRGKNTIQLDVPDTGLTNLSIAVTDAGLPLEKNTIISQLLLCGDLKGSVYDAAYYFSDKGANIAQHLDLVMLTHGWRRFNWADVVQGKMPVIKYPRESDYMRIEGRFYSGGLKLAPDQKLLLVLQNKDSSRQRLVLPVKADGSFHQDGVTFFDTLKVFYQLLGDKKLANQSAVTMEDGLLRLPLGMIKRKAGEASDLSLMLPDTNGWARGRWFAMEEEAAARRAKGMLLKEVVVSGRAKRSVDLLDDKYTTGMFKRPGDFQYDMINDPWASKTIDVFHFLQNQIPGLTLQYRDGIPVLRWRDGSPSLFVDEVGTRAEIVNDLPIQDIAYVKVYRPPFVGAIGGGRGGAIAIYTRKGDDVATISARGLNYKLLEGYSPYKQFYSPDYAELPPNDAPDERATLYWNPYIMTDATNHSVRLEFYNNDVSRRLRIIVEGMNAEGKLVRVEKIIE